MESKVCTKCGAEKPLEGFSKDNSKKDGRYSSCKSCVKTYHKKRYKQNKEKIDTRNRKYYEQNRKKECARLKKYYEQNKERRLAYVKEYEYTRRQEDSLFRLKKKIRRLIQLAHSNQGYTKNTRTHEILGCSYKEFEAYLNNNPYGFTIECDGLDLDHIVPVSRATTEEELLKFNHYTNFQLLPSEYNRHVKRDNDWDQTDFEAWYENQRLLEAIPV